MQATPRTADQLRKLTSAILQAGGSAAAEADLVADHLVQANLAGHDSHGVGMVPSYIRQLKAGLVIPNTRAKVVKDDGAVLMFDGGRGYGRCVAGEAMEAAIARCRQTGVVAVTLANAAHIGRVGAVRRDGVRGRARVAALRQRHGPPRARRAVPRHRRALRHESGLHAIPGTDRQPPLLLDMATSAIAMGKVRVAKNEGHLVPEGILIDENGKPTRDPNVMYREPSGALQTFGGHKGYALAVVTELLAGALSGGPTIQPGNVRKGGTINNMFAVALDPARLAGVDWLRREIDGFVDYLKGSPPADPSAPVLVPGDPERRARQERGRSGIEVDATTWEEILQAAEAVGISREKATALAS